MSTKTILTMALGATMLVLAVAMWGRITTEIASIVEYGLCWMSSASDECRLRGSHLFLVWAVVGIATLVIIGLIAERLSGKS